MAQADEGIAALSECVDSLIVIPNERLQFVSEQKITLKNAFEIADDVLRQGVQSISELVNVTSLINLDFADVKAIMSDSGQAHMGVATATGRDKAEQAASAAIKSALIETSMDNATGVIINITGSVDIGLEEVTQASSIVSDMANPDANVIWGVQLDETLEDAMRITVIATGLGEKKEKKEGAAGALEDILTSSTKETSEDDVVYTELFDMINNRN